jgi:hypothetical protein
MKICIYSLFILLLLVSCSPNKPEEQVLKGLIRVKVLDSVTQSPIPDAFVDFYYVLNPTIKPPTYRFDDFFKSIPNPFTSQADIELVVYNKSLISMTLIDESDPTHNKQIYKDSISAGKNVFQFSLDSTYNDGFYLIKLQKNDSTFFYEVFYAGYSHILNAYLGYVPLYRKLTNTIGNIEVNISDFPFLGKIFPVFIETGQYFGNYEYVDSIRIVLNYNQIVTDKTIYAGKGTIQELFFYVK